jgi:DNA-directed RNA polymerase omega subunit
MIESQNNQTSKGQIIPKFQLVIAAAKRSKQIAREAKERGLRPNQVALVESKHIKPTTLAAEEFKAGKIRVTKIEEKTEKPSEQPAPQAEVENYSSTLNIRGNRKGNAVAKKHYPGSYRQHSCL